MKKLFILIALFISVKSFSQIPPIGQVIGSKGTTTEIRNTTQHDSAYFISYSFPDTGSANRGLLKNIPGCSIRVGDDIFVRNNTATIWIQQAASSGSGTVTNVGLTMPSAFSVANSPITHSGIFVVTGAGTTSQYIRGDGTLSTFPTIPTYTASNGLTLVGNDFQFGGTLTDNTVVNMAGKVLTFNNGGSSAVFSVNSPDISLLSGFQFLHFQGDTASFRKRVSYESAFNEADFTEKSLIDKLYVDAAIISGRPTLQQIFNTQTGGSILTKLDTIKGSGFNIRIMSMPLFTLDTAASIGGIYAGRGKGFLSSNTGFGVSVLSANTSGSNNTAVGNTSLSSNTTGASNTAIGYTALTSITTSSQNTAVGAFALTSNTTGSNTAIGYAALFANTTGSTNTAVGNSALISNTTSSNNVAVGFATLSQNTSGTGFNTAVGGLSLAGNTTGQANTGVGFNSLLRNTTGIKNTSVGAGSMETNTTGGFNTVVGEDALNLNVSGVNNSAFGWLSNARSLGNNNSSYGYRSGHAITTGSENIFMGVGAGDETSGSQKVDVTNSIGIGYTVVTTANNQVVIGNNAQTQLNIFGAAHSATQYVLHYNPSTGEITYADTTVSGGGGSTGNYFFRNTGPTGEGIFVSINDSTVGAKKLVGGINILLTGADSSITLDADTTTGATKLATQGDITRAFVPGGSTTQVQYNNAGAFGGISGATTNGTVLTLTSPVINVTSDATGDLYYRNSGGLFTRLPIGGVNQTLHVVAGIPAWRDTTASTGGTVTSVSGTTNRITSTGGTTPVIDISAAYVGQTSITTLGTVTTGTLSTGAIIGGVTMTLGSDATGDMYYRNSSGILTRVGIGAVNQTLHVVGGLPVWRDTSTTAANVPLSGITAATTTNTINNATFAQAWGWNTLTTQTALALSADIITTGKLLTLSNTNGTINGTGRLLSLTSSGSTAGGFTITPFSISVTNGNIGGANTSLDITTSGGSSNNAIIVNSGNVGILDASPVSALTVGSGDLFQVNSSGNLVKLNNVTTSAPSSQGAANSLLQNDGSGNWSWSTLIGRSLNAALQGDTVTKWATVLGTGIAGDTNWVSTSAKPAFFWDGSDSLIITKLKFGTIGTNDTLGVTIYFNDSIHVTAGATKVVTTATPMNSTTSQNLGLSVTSLNNAKVPPGQWIWIELSSITAGRKPTLLTLSVMGTLSRTP